MSYLQDYRIYSSGDECPPQYHLWCAYFLLACTLNRRVFLPFGKFEIAPNLYVVLTGPPGERKSSAKDAALRIARKLGTIPFAAECITKEALTNLMAAQTVKLDIPGQVPREITPIAVFIDELSEFLGPSMESMISFLTAVYSGTHYDRITKNKGSDVIPNPCLNFIACTTPAYIAARMREDVISGGFSRRAMYVYSSGYKKRVPFPEETPEQIAAEKRIIEFLTHKSQLAGIVTLDPEARNFYSKWYSEVEYPTDIMTTGYYNSKHIQLLKLAILTSVSESDDLVIRKHHLEMCLEILADFEKNLPYVYAGVGRNELAAVRAAMLEFFAKVAAPVPRKAVEVMWYKDANAQEIRELIDQIIAQGTVVQVTVNHPKLDIGVPCLALKGCEDKPMWIKSS